MNRFILFFALSFCLKLLSFTYSGDNIYFSCRIGMISRVMEKARLYNH